MHPIGRYWSSKSHPMPANVEGWIERLPMALKISLASALLNQCDRVFQNAPTLSVLRPTIQGDDAS
ncbi:hypothetical protein [Pseudanabaena sp. 'Roaring Creek']|uniref:hypothetical protein n=1 Tax=Pseudanabaena sp. 'Roaring Creek' TaxID=1681830 RepID=UPI000A82B40D|nr:hypothetical protein [Pseudanabaena sp. 'Roaring Creek']